MKLGIYGGMSTPVHLDTLLVAQAAVEELVDRLCPRRAIPVWAGASQLASDDFRLRLLRLALAGQLDCEVDGRRSAACGFPTRLKRCATSPKISPGAELFCLIGADNAAKIE